MDHSEVGVVIIGDEILSGKHQDKHMAQAIRALKVTGLQLSWVQYLGDDETQLAQQFRLNIKKNCPVFHFGGIGATPDDCTRQAAAKAFRVDLIRHAEAVQEIEAQYGDDTSSKRLLMADLPQGCRLIPNPVNRIPGFSVHCYHFFPGFPSMAWPMMDWVLAREYQTRHKALKELSVIIEGTAESELIEIMAAVGAQFASAKVFSLPHIGRHRYIELGVRDRLNVHAAFTELCRQLTQASIPWQANQSDLQ